MHRSNIVCIHSYSNHIRHNFIEDFKKHSNNEMSPCKTLTNLHWRCYVSVYIKLSGIDTLGIEMKLKRVYVYICSLQEQDKSSDIE